MLRAPPTRITARPGRPARGATASRFTRPASDDPDLTVCNFLSGQPGSGNQIWWNGGYGTAQDHLHSYYGSYLSATTTYFQENDPAQASYGIFASHASGPGLIDYSYASNMNDSGFYIGACPDCNATLDHVHGENGPLASRPERQRPPGHPGLRVRPQRHGLRDEQRTTATSHRPRTAPARVAPAHAG